MTRRLQIWSAAMFLCAGCALFRTDPTAPGDDLFEAEKAYLLGGKVVDAEKLLAEILEDEPDNGQAHFLLADLLDSTGRPAQALPHYLRVIEQSHTSGIHPQEAVAAAMGIVAIRSRVPDFDQELSKLVSKTGDLEGSLPPEASFQLENLDLGLALKRGDVDEIPKKLSAIGCLTEWRTAGPYGPYTWETFDALSKDPTMNAPRGPYADAVDLGAGRGRYPTELTAEDTCTVTTGSKRYIDTGVTWSRTALSVPEAGEYSLRLDTSSSARVFIAGTLVHERDERVDAAPLVEWFHVNLRKGAVDVAVELADSSAVPAFSLVVTRRDKPSGCLQHQPDGPVQVLETSKLDDASAKPARPTTRLALLRTLMWTEDTKGAKNILASLFAGQESPSGVILEAEAELTRMDPDLPGEVSFELARGIMRRALELEPTLYRSRDNLFLIEAADSRDKEALSLIEEGMALCPEEPTFFRRKAEMAAQQGWNREAKTAVDGLDGLLRESCAVLEWRLALARMSNRYPEALKIARRINECDALSTAILDELTRAGRLDEAAEVAAKMRAIRPNNPLLLADQASFARAAGRMQDFEAAQRELLSSVPSDTGARISLADHLASEGDGKRAREILAEGLESLPGPHPILDESLSFLGASAPWDSLRLDGMAIIREYEEANPDYETAAVWVLDRAVHVVDTRGGRWELVHHIAHLTTDEAVEEHGERYIPNGAILLTLRTVKSSGAVREPDEPRNKSTFSMPDLEPGDFIETEYLVFQSPSPLFPGGFDTGRFYFQDFNTAFHRSEMVLIAPKETAVQIDPRGACPTAVVTKTAGMTSHRWTVRGLLPHNLEPGAPAIAEYLPSIRVISEGSMDTMCRRLEDMLADLSRPGFPLDDALSLAADARKEKGPADDRDIYHWVMSNIEDSGDLFDLPSHMTVRRNGNRARLFAALVRRAGRDARLGLMKQLGDDDTPSKVPSLEVMNRAVVLVGETWVSLDQDGAPYGYLPPELREREVLLPDECELTTTGKGAVPEDLQTIAVNISVKPDGTVETTVEEELEGAIAAGWRANLKRIPASEHRHTFEEGYLTSVAAGAVLEELSFDDLETPERPLKIRYSYSQERHLDISKGRSRFTLPFASKLREKTGALPARNTPLVVAAASRRTVSTTVTLPEGMTLQAVSSGQVDEGGSGEHMNERWGVVKRSVETNGNIAAVKVDQRMNVPRVEPAQYKDFSDFAWRMDQLSKVVFTLYQQENPRNLTR